MGCPGTGETVDEGPQALAGYPPPRDVTTAWLASAAQNALLSRVQAPIDLLSRKIQRSKQESAIWCRILYPCQRIPMKWAESED